jgi:hypothetical protein
MLLQVIIFIILIIVICTVIASIGNSNNIAMSTVKEVTTKTFNIGNIKTEIHNNCHLLNIKKINYKTAYLLEGKFSNSCISIYKNDERVHSRIVSGDKSFVITSNLILTSQLFKISKYKSELLPLENDNRYTIVVNNVNDINVKLNTINYEIENKAINYIYEKNIGINEYDIVQEIKKDYPKIERGMLRNVEKENKWILKETGKYLIVYIENIFNIDMKINENSYRLYKSKNKPYYKVLTVDNPDIVAYNLDFISKIKGINREYIDFITSPNNLMSRFLYGKEVKEIDYISQINDKVLVFRLNNP